MKKAVIIGSAGVLVLVLFGGLWFWADNINGSWQSTGQGEFDIFDGDVKIAQVQAKPGSINKHFMIIYDKDYHAMSCGKYGENRFDICVPFEMKEVHVRPDSKLEDIIEYAYMDPMFLQAEFKNYIFFQTLDLSLVPLNESCRNTGECDFMPIGNFRRFWKFGF